MDYKTLHDKFISHFKARNWRHRKYHKTGVEPPCLTEAHHVIPRSFGGADNDSNIVVVTPREHYILHRLLTKISPCRATHAAFAALSMSRCNPGRLSSRQFEVIRLSKRIARSGPLNEEQLRVHHELHLGKKRSEETRLRISAACSGRAAWNKGKALTEEQREPMRKPKTLTFVTCPHCGRSGAKHGMSRYHFEKCKSSPAAA